MKFIHQNVEVLEQTPGVEGMYNAIEDAARTCYKSTGRLGKEFVDKLIKNKHTAMLEHGTVYLTIAFGASFKDSNFVEKYTLKHILVNSPYSKYISAFYPTKETCPKEFLDKFDEWEGITVYYITTNFRVILEKFSNPEEVLQYWDEPSKHPRRISVKITCDRIGSQSLTRHRKFSFAQESTRYCNYSKDKFGKEITYIIPSWVKDFDDYVDRYGLPCKGVVIRPPVEDSYLMSLYTFFYSLYYAEESYMRLLDLGRTPQEARQVLPNALKTEIIMTGFADDWKYFLDVRTTNTYGVPHPDMMELALMIKSKIQHILN